MKRRFKYAFTRKKETDGGFSSMIFAGISLCLFLLSAVLSFIWQGNAGTWVGVLGLMAALFAAVGFWIGIRSFKERDRNYRFSALGSMANGVFFVGWLALFLIGV